MPSPVRLRTWSNLEEMNRPNSDTAVRRTGKPRKVGYSIVGPVGGAGDVIPALRADTDNTVMHIVPYCSATVTIRSYITRHPSGVSRHSVRIEARGSTRVLVCLRSQLCAHLQSRLFSSILPAKPIDCCTRSIVENER
jgi:hypothetical protein